MMMLLLLLLLLVLLVMMMPLRHCREHLLTNRVGHRRHFDVSVCPLKCIPVGFFACDFAWRAANGVLIRSHSLDVDSVNSLYTLERRHNSSIAFFFC